jgi:hypothetical protein
MNARPWDPQDIADVIVGRSRPDPTENLYALQSRAELDAVTEISTGNHDAMTAVFVAGFGGLLQPLLMRMRLKRVVQGWRATERGTVLGASHRVDH